MMKYNENTSKPETLSTLSSQEQEEMFIQALENRLRSLALGRHHMLPRWSAW